MSQTGQSDQGREEKLLSTNRTRFLNDALKHDARLSGLPGWIYIVRSTNALFKIGMTTQPNPMKRIGYLSSQPYDLQSVYAIGKTPNARRAERILHKCFGDRHLQMEWFCLTEEDLEWILTTMEFAKNPEELEAML